MAAMTPPRYRSSMSWTKESVLAFRDRDWNRFERTPVERSARSSELISASLYEQVRAAIPGWPTRSDRDEDLAAHLRLVELFTRIDDARRRRLGAG